MDNNNMTKEDWQAVIATMRSAPLQNMAHAEVVDKLISKVGKHAFGGDAPDVPDNPGGTE